MYLLFTVQGFDPQRFPKSINIKLKIINNKQSNFTHKLESHGYGLTTMLTINNASFTD